MQVLRIFHQIYKKETLKNGFTLVELLVAISIIAILTAIVLPNFMGAREKAKDAQKKSDLTNMRNALRLYYNDNQSYPADYAGLQTALATYAPQMANMTYTYTYAQTYNGDGFQVCVELESPVGTEASDSQTKCNFGSNVCGVAVGSNTRLYVVCGN